MKEQYYNAEKRVAMLEAEKDELAATAEQAERSRKQAELEAAEGRDQANELNMQVSNLNAAKRKIEGELQVNSFTYEKNFVDELRDPEARYSYNKWSHKIWTLAVSLPICTAIEFKVLIVEKFEYVHPINFLTTNE